MPGYGNPTYGDPARETYASQLDLLNRGLTSQDLLQLADDANTGDINNQDVKARIGAALVSASGTVDSYCRQRYAVPLQASDQITSVTVTLAIYNLFARRRRVPEDVKALYDDAMKFLRDVAAGKAALDQPTGAPPQSSSGDVKTTELPEKFSDENLDGFV